MTKELAKTLTTALVQFIDESRPEGSICCSNAECESIENAFREDNFFYVETLVERKLSRLTEFELSLRQIIEVTLSDEVPNGSGGTMSWAVSLSDDDIKKLAPKILTLAREQFIKDGYIIEKKAFHDAVENVDLEVMKEVSDNVDKENELAKKYLEGYTKGYKDAEKWYNDFVAYRFPTIPAVPSGFGCDGIRCTNPQMDCINCPRRTGGGFNTSSGTSTSKAEG